MSGLELFHGAAAEVLGEMAPASIDMAYSDPPFNTGKVWTGKTGSFDDRWRWSPEAARGWDALHEHSPSGAALLSSVLPIYDASFRAYLGVMAGMLVEVRRALKPTGTLWLHFDDTAGAQLRMLGDIVFGPQNAAGLVIWKRTSAHSNRSSGFGRIHDCIAVWARTPAARWRLWRASGKGRGELVHGDPMTGVLVDGLLDDSLNPRARERADYPTQKPVALLERLIRAATMSGDVVLDPTCGSGTTLVAARRLGRRAIGIDLSADAIRTARERLDLGRELGPLFAGEAA